MLSLLCHSCLYLFTKQWLIIDLLNFRKVIESLYGAPLVAPGWIVFFGRKLSRLLWEYEFNCPTWHNLGRFRGNLRSQSLDWYWQTKQFRTKYTTVVYKTAKIGVLGSHFMWLRMGSTLVYFCAKFGSFVATLAQGEFLVKKIGRFGGLYNSWRFPKVNHFCQQSKFTEISIELFELFCSDRWTETQTNTNINYISHNKLADDFLSTRNKSL